MKRACALLLIGATGAASAQTADGEHGFYVGARAGVAKYPGQPKLIVGTLGLLFQDVDSRLSGTQAGVPFTLSSSSGRGGKLYVEAGVSYRFDEHWKASLGVTHLSDIGDEDRTGRADIRNVFLGLTHQF
jgi:hypothetical protein